MSVMEILHLVIVLLHPIAALGMLWWLLKQHDWKKWSKSLKGEQRKTALDSHETWGNRIFPSLCAVITLAFLANAWRGYSLGTGVGTFLVPTSFHGATGLLGSVLLYFTWRWGRATAAKRDAGETWNATKTKHGRAADFIIILGFIHAFIGFLYIFKVI